MRRRAEAQQGTRDRIVAATVELHERIGPAATTISDIAARAGVQRQTVYRHFPGEPELLAACSASWMAQNPPPDPTPWAMIDDPLERLEQALRDLYASYRRTARMTDHLLRDAAVMPALAQLLSPLAEYLAGIEALLLEPFSVDDAAQSHLATLVGLAVAFPTWKSLARDRGLEDDDAARFVRELAAALA